MISVGVDHGHYSLVRLHIQFMLAFVSRFIQMRNEKIIALKLVINIEAWTKRKVNERLAGALKCFTFNLNNLYLADG